MSPEALIRYHRNRERQCRVMADEALDPAVRISIFSLPAFTIKRRSTSPRGHSLRDRKQRSEIIC